MGESATSLRATILTEAGPALGLGHLARCVALYDALESLGVACELVVAGEAPPHVVESRCLRVHDWRDSGALECVEGSDVAVVDSYHAGLAVYQGVADAVTTAVYFDDDARLAYPRGLVVNGAPSADDLYAADNDAWTLLLGPVYQVLRREFWDVVPRKTASAVRRVLVVSGGTDAAGVLASLSAVAAQACPDAILDVVDTPRDAATMRRAMQAADVAITAAGQTLYELAAAGTPVIAVRVAANQVAHSESLERAGVIRVAGTWGEAGVLRDLARLLAELRDADVRTAMSAAGQALVDGQGARRVARICVRSAIVAELELSAATDADEVDLLELANDPDVRAMSFTGDRITADGHHRWLENVLGNPAVMLLVARYRGSLVGQVRFDLDAPEAVVSISISRPFRGLGLAGTILEHALCLLRETRPDATSLVARVKSENAASCRFFESVGFSRGREPCADVVMYRRSMSSRGVG